MQYLFRLDDPPTSKKAAVDIQHKLSKRRQQFLDALILLGKPSTANEIAAVCDASVRESIRKRAHECVRLGIVRECGVMVCGVTGKLATGYGVVQA